MIQTKTLHVHQSFFYRVRALDNYEVKFQTFYGENDRATRTFFLIMNFGSARNIQLHVKILLSF